jgi:hypothetical protein
MIGFTKNRPAMVFGAVAISAMCLGTGSISAASAATPSSAPHAILNSTPVGTYELYENHGSGFAHDGQLFLFADHSFDMSNFSDVGTWNTFGKTVGLADSFINGELMAKIGKQGLGTAAKPGNEYSAGEGELFTWYAVKD